jgi:hypothetical protein
MFWESLMTNGYGKDADMARSVAVAFIKRGAGILTMQIIQC